MITVIDVLRSMGIEPSKQLSWKIGIAVVTRFRQINGALPIKDLRTKTSGTGVHCFALYPESFRPEIVSIINDYFDRQYDFCGRQYSLADLAGIRGVPVAVMRRRLQSYNVFMAVRG